MKRIGPSEAASRGFTLIELMIAITILAVVAILSWRGLDQIVRAREGITSVMASERVLAQTFDQMGSDLRAAATDDEAGGTAILVGDDTLQIVRRLEMPGEPSRLQVVRYRTDARRLLRWASAPIATVGELRASTGSGDGMRGGSQVILMHGVDDLHSRAWIDGKGLSDRGNDMAAAASKALSQLTNPMNSGAPLRRSVTGVQVEVSLAANSGQAARYVRLYPVGQ